MPNFYKASFAPIRTRFGIRYVNPQHIVLIDTRQGFDSKTKKEVMLTLTTGATLEVLGTIEEVAATLKVDVWREGE